MLRTEEDRNGKIGYRNTIGFEYKPPLRLRHDEINASGRCLRPAREQGESSSEASKRQEPHREICALASTIRFRCGSMPVGLAGSIALAGSSLGDQYLDGGRKLAEQTV
jgi:hypothetical protein